MAGDHKCPLCEATFTRPQHVGRHLRAHTGDRPYACKECPLRFARSDLLSRHVNKTHRPPDENAPVKESKRGRRKSLGSAVDGQPLLKSQDKARAASFSLASGSQPTFGAPFPEPLPKAEATTPLYNIQALPPNYVPAGSSTYWQGQGQARQSGHITGMYPPAAIPTFVNPFANSNAVPAFQSPPAVMPAGITPFTAPTMAGNSSGEYGSTSSSMTRDASSSSWSGLPGGVPDPAGKRRACDQCNQAKVRCDTAEPCSRCVSKHYSCSFNKPHKVKSGVQPVLGLSQTGSIPGYISSPTFLQLNTSLSPDSSFSSPYSSTSPVSLVPNHPTPSTLLQQEYERRRSSGNVQPQYRPLPRHSLPFNPYPHSSQPTWQMPDYQPQARMSYTAGMNCEPNSVQPVDHLGYPSANNPYHNIQQQSAAWPQVSQQHLVPIEPQRQSSVDTPGLRDQSSSSPMGLAVTPALTTNSTSPPGESIRADSRASFAAQPPFEAEQVRRESSTGAGALKMSPYDMTSSVPAMPNMNPMFTNALPNTVSNVPWLPPAAAPPAQITSLSAPEAPVDQMYQFRTSADPRQQDDDDTTESQADSSAALSTYLDMDDMSYQNNLEYRRRASTNGGVWATAFNNMTLHDSAGNPLPPQAGLPIAPTSMFNPSLAQIDPVKRPSLSAIGNSHVDPTSRLPSMSDVKDLWKMFMTDPLTGPTPSKEKAGFLDFGYGAQPVTTPRPNMGNRTLSKSNSMPDLKSPSLTGQAFFLNVSHGGVNRSGGAAGLEGSTPIAPVPPILNDSNGGGGGDGARGRTGPNNEELRQWQEKIKHRQASFSMAMQHPGTIGKRTGSKGAGPASRSESIPAGMGVSEADGFPFDTTNGSQSVGPSSHTQIPYTDYALPITNASPVNYADYANRPMASVLQHNSALYQTLGPERAPSFGLTGGPVFDAASHITANFPTLTSQYPQSHQYQPQAASQPPLTTYTAQQLPIPNQAQGGNGQLINARSAAAGGKVTSALARPGNKRLASQSLAGAGGKKANFLLFGGADEDEGEDGGMEGSGMEDDRSMGYGTAMETGSAVGGGMGGIVPVMPAQWHRANA